MKSKHPRLTPAEPAGIGTREIRLAVAARPALYRELLRGALGDVERFVVVGDASDEETTTELLSGAHPGVLLFDYEALGPGAESIVSRLRSKFPATRVLVLATRSGDDTAERVLRAGASGLVPKETDFATVVRAIRAIAAGQLWANRVVTAQALERLTTFSTGLSGNGSDGERLTRREADIVEHVCRGLRNKEIGRRLGISEQTVKTHLNNVLRKLNLANRTALVIREMERRA